MQTILPLLLTLCAESGVLPIAIGSKAVTAVHYGAQWDKPFLYPLRTPSGVTVSRGWPVETRAGDSNDHSWHRGLFFGHGDVNGVDLWRELGREKTGRLVLKRTPALRDGAVTLELDMMPPTGARLGSMTAWFQFAAGKDAFTIDCRIEFHADAGVALRLGDTEEAVLAVRLREEFRQDRGARLINSDGLAGTENIWGKRARWTSFSAVVEGKAAGVAIYDDPSNFRFPTFWHSRGYGLNAANPFGGFQFTKQKANDGTHTIPAGKSLALAYRVLIHDGDAAIARVSARDGGKR